MSLFKMQTGVDLWNTGGNGADFLQYYTYIASEVASLFFPDMAEVHLRADDFREGIVWSYHKVALRAKLFVGFSTRPVIIPLIKGGVA